MKNSSIYIKFSPIIFIFSLFLSYYNYNEVEYDKLRTSDYRLFQKTDIWELAEAVKNENIELISELVQSKKSDINTIEPKYGQSLLFLTISNNHFKSFKKLIELGIDINIHNTIDSSSAIHFICKYQSRFCDYTRYMEYLLKNGADVNDKLKIGNGYGEFGSTPLMIICSNIFENGPNFNIAKMLVENGADINYIDSIYDFALSCCLVGSNYDIALYLIKKGAKFKIPFQIPDEFTNRNIFIMEKLAYCFERLGSKEHKNKLKLIKYLESKGLEYKRITDEKNNFRIIEIKRLYPNTWKDYLKKY